MIRTSSRGLLCTTLLLVMLATPAFATQSPGPETCKAVGNIAVDCYSCDWKTVEAKIWVPAVYGELTKECFLSEKVLAARCAYKTGNFITKTNLKWRYKLGVQERKGHYRGCK